MFKHEDSQSRKLVKLQVYDMNNLLIDQLHAPQGAISGHQCTQSSAHATLPRYQRVNITID